MRLTIKSIANLKIKSLLLTLFLWGFMWETAQAQSAPPIPFPAVPPIPFPTFPTPFQMPIQFQVRGNTNNTSPSVVSAIKQGNNANQIQTRTGNFSVNIPAADRVPNTTVSVSSINVVVPSTNTVNPGTVNFNVITSGSGVNSVQLSFPSPLD